MRATQPKPGRAAGADKTCTRLCTHFSSTSTSAEKRVHQCVHVSGAQIGDDSVPIRARACPSVPLRPEACAHLRPGGDARRALQRPTTCHLSGSASAIRGLTLGRLPRCGKAVLGMRGGTGHGQGIPSGPLWLPMLVSGPQQVTTRGNKDRSKRAEETVEWPLSAVFGACEPLPECCPQDLIISNVAYA